MEQILNNIIEAYKAEPELYNGGIISDIIENDSCGVFPNLNLSCLSVHIECEAENRKIPVDITIYDTGNINIFEDIASDNKYESIDDFGDIDFIFDKSDLGAFWCILDQPQSFIVEGLSFIICINNGE